MKKRALLFIIMLTSSFFLGILSSFPAVRADTQDYFPGTETATKGTVGGAAFPGAIQTSDDSYRTPQEANTAPAGSDVAPDAEQLIRGTSSGFANLLSDDGSNWQGTEGAVGGNTQQYTPASRTIIKGTQTAGTVPTCTDTSDDSRCTWQEADQAAAPTDLLADVETITTGTKVSGDSPPTPSDVDSDNGVSITYREANTAPSQTLAFDTSIESIRTGTTDPYTWSHIPVGTPKGILVTAIHGIESTDCIVTGASTSYGGVQMSRVTTAADTLNEPGRVYVYFLGSGIPTGTQTVSMDIAATGACSTTDFEFISISYTAGADTQVLTSDIDQENQANPTTTLSYSSREALAIMAFYSGSASSGLPFTSACSGNSVCTLVDNYALAVAYSATVDRQSTRGAVNQVMGYTIGTDDVALAYVAITQTDSAANYQISIKYDWTTETCANTRRLTVNAWHTNTEDILVQVYPASEGAPTTQLTITATADGTTLTYDLTTDEWDSGDPNIRFLGNTESGDTTQTDLLADYVVIRCISPADYELEVKLSWTSVGTTGTEWRLFIEGREGASNPEQIDIKIYAADEVALSGVVCSIISTTEAEYDCGVLTTDQLDGGSPDILLIDNNQAADGSQSTVDIDYVRVQRTFNRYEIQQAHKWVTTVTTADAYQLRVRALRSDEDILVQVWDWIGSSWATRITVNVGTETLFTYTLASTERAANGTVMTKWLGSSETSSDETQSTVTADQEIIQRSFNANYEVQIKYSWTGVDTSGNSWTLVIECKRVTNPENGLIQVLDSTETTWTTRYTCNADTDTTYNTYALTTDELDGGSPDIRLLGATESGDTTQSTWDLDLIKIVRDYTPANSPPTITQYGITPTSGTFATAFTFFATYTDIDNDPPTYMKIEVQAVSNRSMNENNTGDVTYTDGKAYYLSDAGNTWCPATRNFFFSTSDGTYSIRTTPSSSWTVSNTAPTISNGASAPTTVIHGNLYSFDFDATDVDVPVCQSFTWSKVSGPTWLSMAPATGVLSGTAPDDTSQGGSVTVRVSDGTATNDFGPYSVTITNADPTWTANSPPTTIHHGDPYSYDFNSADTDPLDDNYFTKDVGVSWLSINQASGVYSGTTPHTLSSGGSNTVTVHDQAIPNGTAEHIWSITITNEDPAYTSGEQSTETAYFGFYSHDYNAADNPSDPLYFTLVTNDTEIQIGSANGTVWGLLSISGIFWVNATVHDDADPNGTDWNNYTLTVEAAPPPSDSGSTGGLVLTPSAYFVYRIRALTTIVDFFGSGDTTDTWLWTFGDGTQSSLQNPSHEYRGVLLFSTFSVTHRHCTPLKCNVASQSLTVVNVLNIVLLTIGIIVPTVIVGRFLQSRQGRRLLRGTGDVRIAPYRPKIVVKRTMRKFASLSKSTRIIPREIRIKR